jgi:hypothetical protein
VEKPKPRKGKLSSSAEKELLSQQNIVENLVLSTGLFISASNHFSL